MGVKQMFFASQRQKDTYPENVDQTAAYKELAQSDTVREETMRR